MIYNGHYQHNTSIEGLYLFHLFDKGLQSILLSPSLFIENSFKTKLAYLMGEHFGVFEDEYLNESHYVLQKNSLKFVDLKKDIKHRLKKLPNDATKYYQNNHNHLPPWIALKNISFADSLNLFTLIRDSRLKGQIVDAMLPPTPKFDFGLRLNFLIRSLHLYHYRSHGSR